jgi:Flp pilus assembly protein TadB
MDQKLASEKVVVAAPMSLAGSAARIWKITDLVPNVFVKWMLLVPIASMLVVMAWMVVAVWYILFGILLVPYRLIRRSGRKSKRQALQHRELLDSINKN